MGMDVIPALDVREVLAGTITCDDEIYASNGSAGAPSYGFDDDNDTGIYWRTTNSIAISTGGTAFTYFDSTGTHTSTLTAFGNASLSLIGADNDEGTAVGAYFNNSTALTTAGGKLASFNNNAVEKAFIDKDGQVEMAALNAAPTPSANSRLVFYIDETLHNLKVAVKYADGTAKTGTFAFD